MLNGAKLAITGASGQLGYYCRVMLQYKYGCEVVAIDRPTFADPDELSSKLRNVDVVLHLAGVNRGSDEEITQGNRYVTERLIAACSGKQNVSHLIFASSIHAQLGSVYGNAKRAAGEALEAFCAAENIRFTNLPFVNLFGEFSRPNYNNFTGTFCHQLVDGKELTIHGDNPVNLMHYGEACEAIAKAISDETDLNSSLIGHATSVMEVAEKLSSMFAEYNKGVIPDVSDKFDLDLFNTLRQVMFEKQFPISLKRHSDPRGSFMECVRASTSGQTSISTTKPGIVRGDHFHFDKVERFLVLSGKAEICVRRVFDEHIFRFVVDGDNPCFVDMPTLHTHNIKNIGESELLTLFWTNDFFDPENPDTYVEAV